MYRYLLFEFVKLFKSYIFRAFHDVQLRIFTEVFGKAYKIAELIGRCQIISDFRQLEGTDSKTLYLWSSPKCEKDKAENSTKK